MYPQQHFGLVDNDCVPVTLFEVPDLVALATSQMQWIDLVGLAPDDPKHNDKVGLLLVTEAHLEYNAGLVISIGSRGRPSPITSQSSADVLAEELADYRLQLLAMARPPINPTDCSQGATMFTPLVGVPMENSLDLVIVWAMYGSFTCKTFWPMPNTCPSSTPDTGEGLPVRWPKKAHPGALSEAGQERAPWLTRWARATFEQCSSLPLCPMENGSRASWHPSGTGSAVAQLARWSFACSQPSPRTPAARVPCGLHGCR